MLKRIGLLVLAAAVCCAVAVSAKEEMKGMGHMKMTHMHKQKDVTMTGELVDTGCYLNNGAHGDAHQECAAKCISGGMPMGLLTKGGQLYLLTLNHDNPDPYNSLKDMAGKQVTVSGAMMERAGMKGIDVASAKLAMADNAK